MDLLYWDGMLRGAAVALFLLLGWRFVVDWQRALTARLGAPLMLGAASYVFLIVIDSQTGIGFTHVLRMPLHIMSLAAPGLFWLFTASWFDDEFELHWWHWAFVAGMVISGLLSNYLVYGLGYQVYGLQIAWRLFSIVSLAMALRAMVQGWANDLVESRRHVRIRLVVASSIAILWVVVAELWVKAWPPPPEWRIANAAGLTLLAGVVAGSILGWRDPALLAAPAPKIPPAAGRTESDDSVLLARLGHEMSHERLYRQDGLTITTVAARLGVPEYRLRRAINQGLGARNFNAYLNSFRLQEAEEALSDPSQREVPILTIAMDAGFGSLAPFNRAFRDRHGCTPTEYRASKLL